MQASCKPMFTNPIATLMGLVVEDISATHLPTVVDVAVIVAVPIAGVDATVGGSAGRGEPTCGLVAKEGRLELVEQAGPTGTSKYKSNKQTRQGIHFRGTLHKQC